VPEISGHFVTRGCADSCYCFEADVV